MNRNDSVFKSTSYYHQRFPVNCQLVFERCQEIHEILERPDLKPEHKAAILGENARRFYGR